MKDNFVKILLVFLLFVSCLSLCGCNSLKEVAYLDDAEEYSLVSSSDRLVFKKGDSYKIYYMKDNMVEKIENAKAFSSSYYANEYYARQNALLYKSVKCINNIVIFEMNEEYLNENKYLTKTDLIYTMEESGFIKV